MRLLFPPLYSISDDLAEFSSFVEQLEHAAQLLESERPAEHRMALVVLDSLAEVLLFHRAHRHIETRDSLWHGGVGYSTDERDRILRRFNRKVQIAATDERDFHYPEALLDELDASIFRVAHSYRNAAYHRGRQNKALAAPLGRLYAAAIARAFARSLRASGRSRNSFPDWDLRLKEVRGYDPRIDEGWFDGKRIADETAARIETRLLVDTTGLARNLRDDCQARCSEVSEQLAGLERDGLDDEHRADLIEGAQHWAAHHGDTELVGLREERLRLEGALSSSDEISERQVAAYRANEAAQLFRMSQLRDQHRPAVSSKTTSELTKEADSLIRLGGETGKLLSRYRALDERLELLEDAVSWAVVQWDRYVQQGIDEARGK
jgi:hypothetical protein